MSMTKESLDKVKHIHYWDNGSWSAYDRSEEDCEAYRDENEEWPDPIAEGDGSEDWGYAPSIVRELAAKSGITVGSI